LNDKKNIYGLLGKNISYSFSKKYFTDKFKKLNRNDCEYLNFDLNNISEFKSIFENNKKIKGLNVTIPYKQAIIPYLDNISNEARQIGAVNTIKIHKNKLIGFNTDIYGFKKSLKNILEKPNNDYALILGWGGAAKGVKYVLNNMGLNVKIVSRKPYNDDMLSYNELNKKLINKTKLIVNCTPLGTFPKIDEYPKIPYQYLNSNHILFDLIYNPPITKFLKKGLTKGTVIKNGLEMLEYQAEKSWEIWNT